MGRASNRKKAARQGQGSTAPVGRRAVAVARRALEAMEQERLEREADEAAASLEWCRGEPIPADQPDWPEGSLGDRFFAEWQIAQARMAPSLRTADVPPGMVITDDPAHWNVAHFPFQLPEDREALAQIGKSSGNPLEDLVTSGAVTRAAVLPTGLRVLAALTALCQGDAASLPQAGRGDRDPH